jgi:threonine dehydrogenase-like Zn-dependent dehydrogenase
LEVIQVNGAIPTEMRALVLDGTGFDHLRVRRVPTPRPGPRQLLARVDAAGICTSLIKLVEQGPEHQFLYGWDIEQHPLILGDEGSVTVVEVGAELEDEYCLGERYVVQPAVDHAPINHRERYRDGARSVQKIAVGYTLGGNLAEYILITEEILEAGCLLPVGDSQMPYAHASLAEPLSCVVSAQDHHLHLTQETPLSPRGVLKGLRPGGVTVIVGAGVMGRMHVDIALSYRPRAIVVSDLIEERLDVVRRLFGERAEGKGVRLSAINPMTVDVKAVVDELTSYGGADDVIVAVGSKRAIESAQHLVGRGSVLDLFGGLRAGQADVSLDSRIIHYKEINVTGSSGGSPWDIARTLKVMAEGEIDAAAHITRIGDLDHAADFLAQVKAQEIDGKAIVYPHRHTAGVRSVGTWTAEDERAYLEPGQ